MSFSKMLPFLGGHIRSSSSPQLWHGVTLPETNSKFGAENGMLWKMMTFFFLVAKGLYFQDMCLRDTGRHLAFQPSILGVAYRPKNMLLILHWEDASESDPWEIIILLLRVAVLQYSAASFINCSCDSNTCCSQHTTPPKTNSVSFHFPSPCQKEDKTNDVQARHV